jgi:hypothetical protein
MIFSVGDIIILAVIGLVALSFAFVYCLGSDNPVLVKIVVLIIEIVLVCGIVFGCAAYNTKTESGKRHLKSASSEYKGGLDRTVTVYDINGEEIAKYTGKFDVEENAQEGVVKIKFDCDGKRHIIYAQTGTVLIDEN